MKEILQNKPTQVIENLTGIALGNGFSLPEDMNRKEWAEQKFEPSLEQDEYISNFLISLLEVEKIRDYFIAQLKRTLNPRQYGIDRDWRQTQYEALLGIIDAFENWFTRPLIEMPTGTGKSMVWGAIIRAFYDTLRVFGVEDKFEITLFTSRINIAGQMISVPGHATDDEDEPLEYGDVKLWLPQFSDNDIRILAGSSRSQKERTKNAKLTLACYQGLNAKSVDFLFRKKAGLVINDESHRVTSRVRIIQENKFHTAFFVGGSATTKGPYENNPFIFFEAMKPEKENGEIVPYNDRLAYHAPILMCIERGELKPVRYVNVRTNIDLSSIESSALELPAKQVAKIIAKNLPIMKEILKELFLKDYPVLNTEGVKTVVQRKWLCFVDRVEIAKQLALFCNKELKLLLLKKFGKQVHFVADYVSGEMGISQFNKRMKKYHQGVTTFVFTSEKLGEGADVPDINGILSFRPYSARAIWKLIQEIGRGERFISQEDLLFVDGVFKSIRHEIASMLTVFGVNKYVNGGLVAGYTGQRETEMKVFTLLKEGKGWKKIWKELNEEEKELVPFMRKYLGIQGLHGPENIDYHQQIDVNSIEFVENQAVKTRKQEFYSTWQEASQSAIKLGIKNSIEYKERYKEDEKLHSSPNLCYLDFPGWQDFLDKNKKYPTSKEAADAALRLGLNSSKKYLDGYKIDEKLPANPDKFYSDFSNWYEFFGKNPKTFYTTWRKASSAAQSLGIQSGGDYKEKRLKDSMLPGDLNNVYKNFPGWKKFLGKDNRFYKTWRQASLVAVNLGASSVVEYHEIYKQDFKLPCNPDQIYQNFPGWDILLGKKSKKLYSSLRQIKKAVTQMKIKSKADYDKKYRNNLRLPAHPDRYEGWPGWKKFLEQK